MFPTPDKLCQNAAPPVGRPQDMDLTGLVMERKEDGFRLLVNRHENGVTAYTRTGKTQTGKLPIHSAILEALPVGTWLDGEIVVYDQNGFSTSSEVQRYMGSNLGDPKGRTTYVVFDVLAYNGLDIRPLPLSERRNALEILMMQLEIPSYTHGSCIEMAEQVPASHKYHDELVALGYEGTIVKDPNGAYHSGKRGQGWIKFKANDTMDAVIMGYKPGENSFTGLIGAIEFGQYKPCDSCNGHYTSWPNSGGVMAGRAMCPKCYGTQTPGKMLVKRGRCSGMTMAQRIDFTNRQKELLGGVIELAYMGITEGDSPRHPQFKKLRTDKTALECDWV